MKEAEKKNGLINQYYFLSLQIVKRSSLFKNHYRHRSQWIKDSYAIFPPNVARSRESSNLSFQTLPVMVPHLPAVLSRAVIPTIEKSLVTDYGSLRSLKSNITKILHRRFFTSDPLSIKVLQSQSNCCFIKGATS
jgi:hypothetical protein